MHSVEIKGNQRKSDGNPVHALVDTMVMSTVPVISFKSMLCSWLHLTYSTQGHPDKVVLSSVAHGLYRADMRPNHEWCSRFDCSRMNLARTHQTDWRSYTDFQPSFNRPWTKIPTVIRLLSVLPQIFSLEPASVVSYSLSSFIPTRKRQTIHIWCLPRFILHRISTLPSRNRETVEHRSTT